MTSFDAFGLAEPLLKAVAETGYQTPTPIQLQAIPPVMSGKDVLGIAQTGTGKTAAFALPILHRLASDRRPTPRRGTRALILSPTRELATQIADSFRTYGKHLGFSVTVIFGGVSERPQIERLSRGVDILVATPGRLLDHIAQRNLTLDMAEIFVLDEADQMLDLGFFKPIRRIASNLPKVRQNLFFSATMPREIEELTRELLKDPVKVAVTPQATTVERVAQRVLLIEQNKKKALLTELLGDKAMTRTLVFTRTKRGADRVAKHLVSQGVEAAAIHGNKSQNQRELALANFRDGKCRVLVATDIAARGIDIDEVSHVVNYELPDVPESYVHRIGRTARAGASGAAFSFCDGGERQQLRDIERVTRQTLESTDRRNDASLASDRPGNDSSHTPRGGRQQRSDDRRAGGRSEGRSEGRSGARSASRSGGEGRAPREQRPAGEERRFGDRPQRTERPAGDRGARGSGARPDRSPSERGFSQRDRSDRPAGDRSNGNGQNRDRDRRDAGGRDEIWTNRGDRPDRQHREMDGRDDRAPRPPRFGDTGREGFRPEGARSNGERPGGYRSDRPHAARANGDRLDAPRSQDDRPARPSGPPRHRDDRGDRAARPAGDRPHRANGAANGDGRGHRGPDRPQGGRPHGGKPFAGRPSAGGSRHRD